jgi:hypothetical protein
MSALNLSWSELEAALYPLCHAHPAFFRPLRPGPSPRQARIHPCRPERAPTMPARSPKTRACAPRCPHEDGAGSRRCRHGHQPPGPPHRRRVQSRRLAGPRRQAPGRAAGPRSAAGGQLGRWCASATRPGGAAGKLPRECGREKEQRSAGEKAGRAVRHLCARRLWHRPPRRGHDLRHRPVRPIACAGPLLAAEIDAIKPPWPTRNARWRPSWPAPRYRPS